MIPGVGFFYSGLARRKSALSLIWLSMMSTAVVSFQVRGEPHLKSNNYLVREIVMMFRADSWRTPYTVVFLGVQSCVQPHCRQVLGRP
jgi:hypothetical protein